MWIPFARLVFNSYIKIKDLLIGTKKTCVNNSRDQERNVESMGKAIGLNEYTVRELIRAEMRQKYQ